MRRTKFNNTQKVAIYQQAWGRMQYAQMLGKSYNNNRDLYEALGYKTELQFIHYYTKYKRQDIAAAVINKPINATWKGKLKIRITDTNISRQQAIEGNRIDDSTSSSSSGGGTANKKNKKNKKDTRRAEEQAIVIEFGKKWREIQQRFSMKSTLKRLDTLASLGRYAVLYLGMSETGDVKLSQPITKGAGLSYIKPLSEQQATISATETDPTSPRFGLPLLYVLMINGISITVHYSRVIHIALEVLDDEVYGVPVLEKVYNRLEDIEKVAGGSAEMFWRGARPGYQGKMDKDYQATPGLETALIDQLDEYEHNMRRFLIQEGVEFSALQTQVEDPSNHIKISIQLISAATEIPARMLVGSEMGELASSQDRENWLSFIQSRREETVEPNLLYPVIARFQELGFLPTTSADMEYSIEWQDLRTESDKDKAEVGKSLTESIVKYSDSPASQDMIPPYAFFTEVLGFDEDKANIIMEAMLALDTKEEDTTEEEEELIAAEKTKVIEE